MRPLELTVQGFRSYRERQSFGFSERGLFGIVGPTGSGKSSILDAMIFALYGKAPNTSGGTKQLIHSASDEATVELAFAVDDRAWQVTRVLRRKGSPPVVLKRVADGETEEQGARAVSERIEELIGLDFDGFCSSVTLPQGEFDRFLTAPPAERTKVLKGIFRLERIDALRDLARTKKGETDGSLSVLAAQLASLPDDPEALIAELEGKISDAEEAASEIRKALDDEAQARKVLEEADQRREKLGSEMKAIEGSIDETPKIGALEELATQEDSVRDAVEKATERVSSAGTTTAKAQERIDELTKEHPPETMQEARQALRDRERLHANLGELEGSAKTLEQELKAAAAASGAATKKASEAQADLAEARKAFEEAMHRNAAHGLRKDLQDGEVCPVCEQPVAKVPAAGKAPALEAARKAVAKEEKLYAALTQEAQEIARSATLAEERARSTREREISTKEDLGSLEKTLAELLGDRDKPADIVARIEKDLKDAQDGLAKARKGLEEARRAEADAAEQKQTLDAQRLGFAQALIKVAERFSIDAPSFDDDAGTLMGAAKRAADAAQERIEELTKELEGIDGVASDARSFLAGFQERFKLAKGETGQDALARVQERLGSLRSDVKNATEAIETRKKIASENEKLLERKLFLEQLTADLTDSRFPAYLLRKQRRLLSSLGSEKLMGLTGRYRFDDDGEFQIVDVPNDVARAPETLSGGETFLASLALALAMAEAVSAQGGRLDCFFLDEGFGSLDPASLDLALDGIEQLAIPGRLIGLISHVGGLQTRLDDLIVLEKEADGSTRVEQTEGPISYLKSF